MCFRADDSFGFDVAHHTYLHGNYGLRLTELMCFQIDEQVCFVAFVSVEFRRQAERRVRSTRRRQNSPDALKNAGSD
jgi:hypothetical protein